MVDKFDPVMLSNCVAMCQDHAGSYVMHSDYEALEARVAELEKDAARYRWLRNLPVGHDDEWIANMAGEHLDSAIDEAMSREA